MIDIVRFDHVSQAVADLGPQLDLLEGLFGFRAGERFELEQLREGQAAGSHATDLEEFTARKPVAVGVAGDALAEEI